MSFAGKVVVVTGGASGIGRATADLFSREGATVVIADKNGNAADEAARQLGGESTGVRADVSCSEDVRALMALVDARFSRLDVLVNNAGFGVAGTVQNLPEEDWDSLMSVNVRSVFLCSKYAIPIMERLGGGAIVNTGSYTAMVAIPNRVAYVTSKGAIAALTRAMALDHATQNIRVNCVAPGTIETPWFDRTFAASDNPDEVRKALNGRAPMNRMGRPEEVAEAILWLASDRATFATGSVLTVDGGTSIW